MLDDILLRISSSSALTAQNISGIGTNLGPTFTDGEKELTAIVNDDSSTI